MFIVIEGTDASGKTSLIEAVEREIQERFSTVPMRTFHKGRPEEETRRWVLNDYVNSIETVNWFRGIGLSDRWHWGEITYAPKYRPHTNKDGYGLLGKAGWRWVELYLMSRGVAQFWLYQPLEVIQERINSRGDEFVKAEDLKEILAQYEQAYSVSNIVGKIEPPADSIAMIPDVAKYIVDTAEQVELMAAKLEIFPHYIGSPNPKVLLVGDTRNITKKHGEETKLPFMPVDGNSGEYLLSALPEELWRHIGIVNINDEDARESFTALWNQLGFPRIIVLGRLAEKTLTSLSVHEDYYSVLPHPQYVRRFFNKSKEEYGDAILRIAQTKDRNDQWILR
jgi:GTPase SAR1 family protein